MKKENIAAGLWKGEVVTSILSDMQEFILAPGDSLIFTYDREENLCATLKSEIEWFYVGDASRFSPE
jgi:hypothetical protein